MDYAQILARLSIGPHPQLIEDIETLRRGSRVTAVLNLQTDEDMRDRKIPWELLEGYYRTCGIELCRVPVRDEVAALEQRLCDCVRALDQLLQARHSVYLHCTFGLGRSPTVAIAYLHWCLGWGLRAAATYVKQLRPCTPSLEAIELSMWDPDSVPPDVQAS